MRSLAGSSRLRYVTFPALYVVQGVAAGLVLVALGNWLASRGWTTGEVGLLTAAATTPAALKIVWGVLVDRRRRRGARTMRWILASQGASMLVDLLVLVPVLAGGVTPVVLAAWAAVKMACVAAGDVAIDALAIDVVPSRERGRVNALMALGSLVGLAIGSVLLSRLLESHGLLGAAPASAAIVGALLVVPLLVSERADAAPPDAAATEARTPLRDGARVLLEAIALCVVGPGRRVVWTLFVVVVALSAAFAAFKVHAVQQLGWSHADLSAVAGGVGAVAALGALILAAVITDRLGAVRTLVAAALLAALLALALGLGPGAWASRPVVGGYVAAQAGLGAMVLVAFATFGMSASRTQIAATQFAAYMSIFNLANAVGPGLAGPLQTALGVRAMLVVAGAIAAGGAFVLLVPEKTRG